MTLPRNDRAEPLGQGGYFDFFPFRD